MTPYSLTPLHDRVILVTGAARRVGSAIVRHLHGQGARIVLHCRSARAEADALAGALNCARIDSAMVVQADLLDTAQLPALVAAVTARYGRLDGLVNNASSFYPTAVGEINETAWQDLVGSNFKAPLFLAQAAAPALRVSGGAIVNITDIHAERPLQGYPLYSAAKGALLTLTRALAVELAPEVRVNAVAPGPILWPDDGQLDDGSRAEIVRHTLLKREGTPEDIAGAVAFLMSAAYITGQVINVDGGRTAHL
ncbi:MAG: pteridine reductase [Rhodocyclaceae bacterium]|nr:MAG: pteridine reductase [Rhodocyclaceae bacterium]